MCVVCGVRPVAPAYRDVQLCEDCAVDAEWFTEQAE